VERVNLQHHGSPKRLINRFDAILVSFLLLLSFTAPTCVYAYASPVCAEIATICGAGQIGHPVSPTVPGASPLPANSVPPELAPYLLPANEQPALKNEAAPTEKPATAPTEEQPVGTTQAPTPTMVEPGGQQFSLAAMINEALKNGPRAAAIRAQLSLARANYATASQGINPGFMMDRGMVAEQEERIGPVMTNDAPWKLYYRMISAKWTVADTKAQILTQIWAARADVRRAFVELVVAQETQKTLVGFADLAGKLHHITQRRFDAGAVPELDVLRAKLVAAQAQTDSGVGSRRVIKARQQLNVLMGRPIDGAISVPPLPDYSGGAGSVDPASIPTDILPDFRRGVAPMKIFSAMALQNRQELKDLGLQIKINQANMKLTVATIVPNPSLAYGKSSAGNPPNGPKLTAVYMTLNEELPLVNFQQGSLYQYAATGKQLNFQIAAQQNQVLSDVSNAYTNLLAARDKIRVYQDRLLAESTRITQLSQRSFESGQSDLTAALAAQQANIQTRSAYLDAVSSYSSALTDLEVAAGRPLR
jgi:outer membrane protein, heavy metal efflux system